jgi:hypothetical protein
MVLNLPLMSALTTPTQSNMREKKKKRNEQKETPTSDQKPNKGKEQDHLKKTSIGPLRQGQRLDTSETKQSSRKKRKPPNQSLKNHKELPLNQCNSPWTKARRPLENRAAATTSAHTDQTGHNHRSDR